MPDAVAGGIGARWLRLLLLSASLSQILLTAGERTSTRVVGNGRELGAALSDDDVSKIFIRGKIRLKQEEWVPGGTAVIKAERHVVLESDKEAPASAVLDLGALVDAIHVAPGAHLELQRLRIPNSGNRRQRRPSARVQLRVVGIFALWPSVTLAKHSRMTFAESVFYYWSDKEWDSCDKFRDAAEKVLNPKNITGMLEWSASDTQVFIQGTQNTSQSLINMLTGEVHGGAFNTTRTNHTLVCLPDPFKEEAASVSWLAAGAFLGSLLVAAAVAHVFGIIDFRPSHTAAKLAAAHGSPGSVSATSTDDSPLRHSSLGSTGSHPSRNNAVEQLSLLVRERQRASIGGLELGELLGRGSFGKVYKGRWRGAIVAVKVVSHDCSLASLAETLRESALSTSIQHPNVVTTFKVRTVRSTKGVSSDCHSAEATWAQGQEGCLDEASGHSSRLFARAMSQSYPGQQKPRSQSMKEFFVSISAPASRSNAEEARALRSLPSRPYHRPTFFDSPKCKTQSQHEEGPAHDQGGWVQQLVSPPRNTLLRDVHEDSDEDEREPLSMAIKTGGRPPVPQPRRLPQPQLPTQPPPQDGGSEEDERLPISRSIKSGRLVLYEPMEPANGEEDEPEPLGMFMKSGSAGELQLQQQAQEAAIAEEQEEAEPLGLYVKSGSIAPQLQPKAQEASSVEGDDDEPEPLGMYMKSGNAPPQPQIIATAEMEGSIDEDDDDAPEPLSMSVKAGTLVDQTQLPARSENEQSGQQGASSTNGTVESQSPGPAIPGAAGNQGSSGGNREQADKGGRFLPAFAGRAMDRLFSIRRPLTEEQEPEHATISKSLADDEINRKSIPHVPSELQHSSQQSDGSAAAQMQEAAMASKGQELLETWLILEYCDQGSFDHAIRNGRFAGNLPSGVLCLMDIAAGMEHLHSLGILHADLKGANVLLKSTAVSNYDGRGYTCKLADFGLSRVMETNRTHVSTSTFGTAAYMPPELLMEGKMSKAADVYSFAMLMCELATGQQLFQGMRQSQIICKVITGWQPAVPPGIDSTYAELMSQCWHADPAQRPPFSEILVRLRNLYAHLRMTRC